MRATNILTAANSSSSNHINHNINAAYDDNIDDDDDDAEDAEANVDGVPGPGGQTKLPTRARLATLLGWKWATISCRIVKEEIEWVETSLGQWLIIYCTDL